MAKQSIEINLIRPSDKSDLTCVDGEVERFVRVGWLEEKDDPDASNPDSPDSPQLRSKLNLTAMRDVLPEGARLIAIHQPAGLKKEVRNLLYIKSLSGGIFTKRMMEEGEEVQHEETHICNIPGGFGLFHKALVESDLITLIGSGGIAWLLYDTSCNTYQFSSRLPSPPQIAVSASPAALSGYVNVAGQMPEIKVGVDLKEYPELSHEDIAAWIEEGRSERISQYVVDATFKAVAEGIERYMEEVSDAGLTLTPVNTVASYEGYLPTKTEVVSSVGYADPYAQPLEWSYQPGSLKIRFRFSLKPYRLTCSFSIEGRIEEWRRYFNKLTFYVATPPDWIIPETGERRGRLRATGYNTLAGMTGIPHAFRFNSRKPSHLEALASCSVDFRKCEEIDISDVEEGIVSLYVPDSTALRYDPHYTDHDIPMATDGIMTDEGCVLISGSNIIACEPAKRMIYRHRSQPRDADILAIYPSALRRSVASRSRLSLIAFYRDGVRELRWDNSGEYSVSKYITSDQPEYRQGEERMVRPGVRMVNAPQGIFFLTRRGLQLLSPTGKITTIVGSVEGGFQPELTDHLLYDHSSDMLILLSGSDTFLIDSDGNLFHDSETVAGGMMIEYDGYNVYADTSGQLQIIGIRQEEDRERMRVPEFLPVGRSYILTRPLKFGNSFRGKRLVALTCAMPGIEVTVMGSDNLMEWNLIAGGVTPLKGLHPRRYRYHKIAFTIIPSLASNLQRFGVTIEK